LNIKKYSDIILGGYETDSVRYNRVLLEGFKKNIDYNKKKCLVLTVTG